MTTLLSGALCAFVTALLSALGSALAARRLLHFMQLESYQLPGYFKTLRRNAARAFAPGLLLAAAGAVACALALWLSDSARGWAAAGAWLLVAAAGAALRAAQRGTKAKKPLVFTPRMKRLQAMTLAVCLALGLLCRALLGPAGLAALPLLLPLEVALAALCAQPIERHINMGFFRDAQRRLDARPGLIRIGITGSYGKTSTKFLLGTILSERYNVLVTPSSFNTPMGVTRVIRERLQAYHEVFIAEMGARHVGDIAELVELVHPTVGLLTSVGPQHLDTFGTLENIKKTKYELIEGLPEDGLAVFARDGAICEELYARCTLARKRLAGEGVRVENLTVGPFGSRFELVEGDARVLCETRLLGEHAIGNLLLCAETARGLGLSLEEIARGVRKCSPVEHRLQLIGGKGGVTVIDDAFNSNPRGAQAALRVLARFPKRRIIVTPGMVELGGEEDAFNEAFGREMAGSVDVAILVGRRHTAPIRKGLLEAGFDERCLHVVGSLEESTQVLGALVRAGDTVLYENDLPDNYSEG